jgi:hypothetical protein
MDHTFLTHPAQLGLAMLKIFFWPKVLRTAKYEKHYFKQDGATAHTSNMIQTWLDKFKRKFSNKDL